MFGWAVDHSLLEASPMVGIKRPAKEAPAKTRTLRDDEIKVFWSALPDAGLTPPVIAALRSSSCSDNVRTKSPACPAPSWSISISLVRLCGRYRLDG